MADLRLVEEIHQYVKEENNTISMGIATHPLEECNLDAEELLDHRNADNVRRRATGVPMPPVDDA
jgi:hypothetical protein